MTDYPPIIRSLLAAVNQAPDDVALRLHVARLLLEAGRATEALEHCSKALQLSPSELEAVELLSKISLGLSDKRAADEAPVRPTATEGEFDWEQAETQMNHQERTAAHEVGGALVEGERPTIRLDDVGGMEQVKKELQDSFLIPMANPALRAAYSTTLGGGLLLYGPPGCGKTFLGRALAGEVGASFYAVSLADILEAWLGQSERNVRALFQMARAHRPSVIFFDEVDAIGQKRANLSASSAMRGTVNQLLHEMDGAQRVHDGIFVLAASNRRSGNEDLAHPTLMTRTFFLQGPTRSAR